MAPSAPRSLLLPLFAACTVLVGGLVALGLKGTLWGRATPMRVLLVVQVSGAPGDLREAEGRALGQWMKDLLETRGRRSVSLVPEAPLPDMPLRPGKIVLVRAHRIGPLVGLQVNVASSDRRQNPQVLTCPAQDPASALDWFLSQLGSPRMDPDPTGRLVPRDPQAFWALLEGMATSPHGAEGDRVLTLLDRVESRAPGCATASLVRADVHYSRILASPRPTAQSLHDATRSYEEALRRWPHHPRAGYGLARLLSDTGHAKEALAVALDLHRYYPKSGPTCSAALYTSRFTGLLEITDKASMDLDDLAVDPSRPQRLQLGQLYLGHWSAFERSLWVQEGEPFNAIQRFHLAYLRLIQGRKEEAAKTFQELEAHAAAYPKYVRLGRVFRFILSGQKEQARKELQSLDDESTGLAVPDGEFTLNLAEAWALLGDQGAAMEAAGRAMGQGFSCTRWYEQSPLLQSLQSLPRWKAMLQSLHSREQRLKELFPTEQFS